jgi:hypothetical protein
MAIQIADSIGDADSKLKSQVRAELAARILDSSAKINFSQATKRPARPKKADQVPATNA